MVMNSAVVGRVVMASADLCQLIACNPERLSTDQVLDLLCYLPFYHLRRLALCLFSFFCFPITPSEPQYYYASYYHRSPSSSSSSSLDSDSDDDYGYDSHSD